jgi:hypothetical protein
MHKPLRRIHKVRNQTERPFKILWELANDEHKCGRCLISAEVGKLGVVRPFAGCQERQPEGCAACSEWLVFQAVKESCNERNMTKVEDKCDT